MELQEVFNYVKTGLGWLAVGGGSYFVALLGTHLASNLLNKKIQSQEELEQIVLEEAKKLGIEGIRIDAHIKEELEGELRKIGENHYRISIGGFCRNPSLVRHELYHLRRHLKGLDNEGFENKLKYWFNEEPRAVLYEAFRLKL